MCACMRVCMCVVCISVLMVMGRTDSERENRLLEHNVMNDIFLAG